MKGMAAAAEPDQEFLDLGLGLLRALVPIHQLPEHLTSAAGVCGRIKLPKIKCSISLFMGGNRDFSSLLYPAAFCSHSSMRGK